MLTEPSVIFHQLTLANVDVEKLADRILSNASFSPYWVTALALYSEIYAENPQSLYPKLLTFISQDREYSYVQSLVALRRAISRISDTIKPNQKVDVSIKEYFLNADLIQLETWLKKFRKSQVYQQMEGEQKEEMEVLFRENAGLCVENIQSILARLHYVTRDERYKSLLTQTLNIENTRIKNKADFLLSDRWAKVWIEELERMERLKGNINTRRTEGLSREEIREKARN